MNPYLQEAEKKLNESLKGAGQKERAMAPAVKAALLDFCRQDGEFAQAVAQGGSFGDCMKEVAKGVESSISDLEAYKKAVSFYFPGAGVQMSMKIDLCASVGGSDAPREAPGTISLSLDDFL